MIYEEFIECKIKFLRFLVRSIILFFGECTIEWWCTIENVMMGKRIVNMNVELLNKIELNKIYVRSIEKYLMIFKERISFLI